MTDNTCICCGSIIPEGRMVCPMCEAGAERKSKHPRTDLYIAERDKGLSHQEIADKYGVSRQTVSQACAKHSPGHFKPYTPKQVVYPNLRRWLNENKVSRSEFARRLGNIGYGNSYCTLSGWLRGDHFPHKQVIDKILAVTGLTYEELWEVDVE